MSTWRSIGRNPYGAPVEEHAGRRRCATGEGWKEEPSVQGPGVCRVALPEDADLAMAAMAVPLISSSFGHQPLRAYAVWTTPTGHPTPETPAELALLQGRPGWQRFAAGVTQALGDAATRAWAARRTDAPGVPRWENTLSARSATSLRGLQWGLARGLEAQAHQDPERRFHEWGLLEPGDAATRRIHPRQRHISALRLGPDPRVPSFCALPKLPPAPGMRSFMDKAEAVPQAAPSCPVIWCTQSGRAHWGPSSWNAWWAWFARPGTMGWVVMDDLAQVAMLHKALQGRADWRTWRIEGPQGVLAWVWSIGTGHTGGLQPCALSHWAGAALPTLPEPPPLMLDDGRVPYRPLSKVGAAEGCVPLKLGAAQQHALGELAQDVRDVDTWVAEGLGVGVAELGLLLSPEQIDAVGLARLALDRQQGFIVADATGFGKGRVLAALAITGLRQGRSVGFLTENPSLFSDFFRDIQAVSPSWMPRPSLLHQSATVRLPNGTVWAKSLKEEAFKAWIQEPNWADGDDRLILTTYAQMARTTSKTRVAWLRHRMGPTGWVLLDESHNAAGDSQAAEQVGTLFKGLGVVFASATFARHEGNLGLYRPALPMGPLALRLVHHALSGDGGLIREVLTEAIASAGHLVRREHPPVGLPQPHWVPMTAERQAALTAFEAMWQRLFEVAEDWEREQGGQAQFAWIKLGAVLSRSAREFSLLLKRDVVVELIQGHLAAGRKVVVAVDSTFEAALRELAAGEAPSVPASDETSALEGDEALPKPKKAPRRMQWPNAPRWKDRWRALLAGIAPEFYWSGGNPGTAVEREGRWRAAEAAIGALPDWDISPLDYVQRQLAQTGVAAGELSGRQTLLRPMGAGAWEAVPRTPVDRAELVASFNRGGFDVLFITRAGSTGISLHAGQRFADQRVRCLIEWDIAPNPVHRVQFWGRVRRKDQVAEPEFWGVLLDTPAERRVVERELRKHSRLSAHMGGRREDALGWVSPEGERLVAEWAEDRPLLARRLGLRFPIQDQPCGRVDRALIRSMVLPPAERGLLVERLERGLEVGRDWAVRSRKESLAVPVREIRRTWWWGDDSAALGEAGEMAGVLRLDVVERAWLPQDRPKVDLANLPLGRGGPEVLALWGQDWRAQTAGGQAPTDRARAVWGWAARVLPALVPGRGLFVTDPETDQGMRGVVLSVEPPLQATGDAWALSQVGLRVWLVGDEAPQTIPLSVCATDARFKVSDKPALASWFEGPAVPRRALTLEGNPILAAAWGRRWGLGRSVLVRDLERGEMALWCLPGGWSWENMKGLPRDLVDVEHAVAFLKKHPSESLQAALPWGDSLMAVPTPGGLKFQFSPATHAKALKGWLGYAVERCLGRPRPVSTPEGPRVECMVPLSKIRSALYTLETAGVGWRVAATHAEWYRKSARERCQEASRVQK